MAKLSGAAFDLDGTLLRSDHTISPRSAALCAEMLQRNIWCTAISARPPESVLRIVSPLGMPGPLGALNGAVLLQPDRTIVARHSIPQSIAADLVQSYRNRQDVSLLVYSGFDWQVSRSDTRVAHEAKAVGFEPTPLDDDVVRRGADKILLAVAPTDEDRVRDELAPYRDAVAIAASQPGYIEITHLQANKGAALIAACAAAGLAPATILAAGDGENDVPMLRVSGWPVTMQHGVEPAKLAAKAVVGSNNDDSLALYVARIFDISLP